MARSRCLPPSLLDDPDYFELNGEAQAILLGLVLCADDHGRGLAHTNWLARKLNRETGVIEAALAKLEANHLLQCYQVERQHYYVLLKWWQWQSGLHNPARPLYPAPPHQQSETAADHITPSRTLSKKVRETSRHFEKDSISSLEGEEEREKESESEREEEDEREGPPANVVTFPPAPRHDDSNDVQAKKQEPDTLHQVARILHLPPDEALLRIVQDYRASPLSLLGEADAAREWIVDPKRNKQHKHMTPAFFRRWLQRECDSRQRHEAATTSQQHQPEARAALRAQPGTRQFMSPGAGLASQSLMDLERRYKASRDSPPSNTQQTTREEGG